MTCTSSSRRWAVVDHYTEVAEYRQYPGTLSRRSERMLEQTIRVLAPHRPRVHSSASHHAAWRARDNVVWYFDRLLDEILGDVRNRRWSSALRGFIAFTRHLPRHHRYAAWRLATPLRRISV